MSAGVGMNGNQAVGSPMGMTMGPGPVNVGAPGGRVVGRMPVGVNQMPQHVVLGGKPVVHQQGAQMQQGGPAPVGIYGGVLTSEMLAGVQPPMQKQLLGERLFPRIQKLQPVLAGKITGMMLDMDNSELLLLLDSESHLRSKVDEALRVLRQAGAASNTGTHMAAGGMLPVSPGGMLPVSPGTGGAAVVRTLEKGVDG
eukprot:Lankesteria_metandrocarpae@DN4516_c0_g1_i1.p1